MNRTVLTAVVILAPAIGYIAKTLSLPEAPVGNPSEPRVFPLTLGILMSVLGAALLVQGLRAGKAAGEAALRQSPGRGAAAAKIAVTAFLGIGYGMGFDSLGCVLSTALFLFAVLSLFNGPRRWAVSAAVSAMFSLLVYLLFAKALGIYLPPAPGVTR
ncbi:MAG: tripartite tricarboxylate transporter TctB family protein [Acidobacteria bacterium]|nr:tripartite tricarboxylate transporter TctB family protein [Acidobacteriota bacterium]